MVISSAYRSDDHPITKEKIAKGAQNGGAHHLGMAVDVHCAGFIAMNIIALSLNEITINGMVSIRKALGIVVLSISTVCQQTMRQALKA